MKKSRIFTFTALCVSTLFTSCSNSSVKLMKEIKENEQQYIGKEVVLEGSIETNMLTWTSDKMKFMNVKLNAVSALNNQNTEWLDVKLPYGEGKNSIVINIPEGQKEYKDSDIIIYDKDGNKLSMSDDVKITAKVKLDSYTKSLQLEDAIIEKD